jgi:FG-GAP repeat
MRKLPCDTGVGTRGGSFATKVALVGIVAICLLIGPYLLSISYGSSRSVVNFGRIGPDIHHRTLTSPNAQYLGGFGHSFAASDSLVVVGAPFENSSGYSEGGHAYVFNSSTGSLIKTLTSPNVQTRGQFGWAVAISGNTVVVGAPFESASEYSDAGHVYSFNAETGMLINTFTSPNMQNNGQFGFSVSASANEIMVGAPWETGSRYFAAGNAYTFSTKNNDLISTLTSPNAQNLGLFGWSVAISSSTAVVGAPMETASGYNYAGHAYGFNAKTGLLMYTLTSANAQTNGNFGDAAAIDGKVVVIGAPSETAVGFSFGGRAYTFNANTGILMNTLVSPHEQLDGYFGNSVAASGKIVAVGAVNETVSGNIGAGRLYTFNAKTGVLASTYTSPKPQAGGGFGGVAADTKVIVAGAPGENASGYIGAGHAYVFT